MHFLGACHSQAVTGDNVTVLAPGIIYPFNWHEVTHCRTPALHPPVGLFISDCSYWA